MSEFQLKLEPAERVTFTGKKLGEEPANVQIKVSNPTKEKCAFKVKCTSNELFRIRPPVGLLKPSDSAQITLTFNAGKTLPDSGKHYVAIYYITVADDKKGGARQIWADHKGDPVGTKRVYVDFKKDDEKKDDDKKDGDKKEDKKEDKKDEDKKEDDKKDDKKEDEKKDDKKDEKKDDEKKDEEKKDDKKDEDKKDDDKKDDDKKDEDKKDDEKKE